jgi:hypothetical protein
MDLGGHSAKAPQSTEQEISLNVRVRAAYVKTGRLYASTDF